MTVPHPHLALAELPLAAIQFRRILLVDDDRQLAEALQWVLAEECFLVEVAYDGAEAFRKIESSEYDAIVCDVMMPKLRGDQLYQRAVELYPALTRRFLFITGFAAEPTINQFLTRTGSRYLIKPFRIQTLINNIKELTRYV